LGVGGLMNVDDKKSILWDAFDEMKEKWSIDEEELFYKREEIQEKIIDRLPESRIKDLRQIKEKYQLDDIDFLFIVGAAIGFTEGQNNVRKMVVSKMNEIEEFVKSIVGKEVSGEG